LKKADSYLILLAPKERNKKRKKERKREKITLVAKKRVTKEDFEEFEFE